MYIVSIKPFDEEKERNCLIVTLIFCYWYFFILAWESGRWSTARLLLLESIKQAAAEPQNSRKSDNKHVNRSNQEEKRARRRTNREDLLIYVIFLVQEMFSKRINNFKTSYVRSIVLCDNLSVEHELSYWIPLLSVCLELGVHRLVWMDLTQFVNHGRTRPWWALKKERKKRKKERKKEKGGELRCQAISYTSSMRRRSATICWGHTKQIKRKLKVH